MQENLRVLPPGVAKTCIETSWISDGKGTKYRVQRD